MPADPFASASELAAAIRARRTSASELVELYLARIERHNPSLNAICTLDAAGAQRRARDANPSVVLPLTRSKDGLPIGVQLVGHRWSEPALLALAQKVALITGPFTPSPDYQ